MSLSWAFYASYLGIVYGILDPTVELYGIEFSTANQPAIYLYIYIYIPSIASCSLIDPPTSGKRLFSIAASIHIYTHMYIPIYVSINSKQMYLCVCAFFYYDVALKFLYQRATAITVLFWGILYIYI